MQNLNAIPLDPQQIDSGRFSTLGTGLWGSVLDVGDGTILKLARRRCAGIGDGLDKIQREATVLHAIHTAGRKLPLATAKVLGWGERTATINDDRTLWLHTTKLPGHARVVSELEKVSDAETRVIAYSICRALADLHGLLESAKLDHKVPGGYENLQMIANEIRDDAAGEAYVSKLSRIFDTLQEEPLPVIHGDFNISNILFEGSTVCAVVDFAETRKGFYEEDLASIIDELPHMHALLIENFQMGTGRLVNEKRLNYALAINAFFTFLICRRRSSDTESKAAQRRLDQLLSEAR